MTPKKAPSSGHAQTPPKQTSKPIGGFQRPSGGGAPHPIDGSQDQGTRPYPTTSYTSPKVGGPPSAKPHDPTHFIGEKK